MHWADIFYVSIGWGMRRANTLQGHSTLRAFGAHEKLPTSAQIELPTPKTGSATWLGAKRGDIIPPQAAKSRVCRCRLGLMADPQQKPRGTSTKTTARSTMAGRPVGHSWRAQTGRFSRVPKGRAYFIGCEKPTRGWSTYWDKCFPSNSHRQWEDGQYGSLTRRSSTAPARSRCNGALTYWSIQRQEAFARWS